MNIPAVAARAVQIISDSPTGGGKIDEEPDLFTCHYGRLSDWPGRFEPGKNPNGKWSPPSYLSPVSEGVDEDGPFLFFDLPPSGVFLSRLSHQGIWWAFTGYLEVRVVGAWRFLFLERTRLTVVGEYRPTIED